MNANRKHARPSALLLCAIATLAALFVAPPARAQAGSDAKTVPVVDGAIGSCTADFTVTDAAGAPVYDAKIRVHIAYRFMSAHKMDLEVGTNADGKARFEGLPNKLKRGLTFYASHDALEGSAVDDPVSTCKAQLSIVLRAKNP